MVSTSTDSAAGKICLITGATNGIGKAAAHAIAAAGATVVIHGRDPARTAATRTEIQAVSGNADIHMLLADFSFWLRGTQAQDSSDPGVRTDDRRFRSE